MPIVWLLLFDWVALVPVVLLQGQDALFGSLKITVRHLVCLLLVVAAEIFLWPITCCIV